MDLSKRLFKQEPKKVEMKKQPFYRNKVALALRALSILNVVLILAIFLRATYLYIYLGWTISTGAFLVALLGTIAIIIIEDLHNKAVDYGNEIYNKKRGLKKHE